jgi:hypothetical protein
MVKIQVDCIGSIFEREIQLDDKVWDLLLNTKSRDEKKDLIFLLTGENTELRHRSKKAIELFNKGNIGSIFVSGGYSGFATKKGLETEAEATANYLNLKGKIPANKILLDGRSLDTLGNFAYPFVNPLKENEVIKDMKSVLLVTEKKHMERAIKSATKIISPDNLYYSASDGDYNPSLLIKAYEFAIEKALENIKNRDPKKVLKFLEEKHPFYQEGWFDKSIMERKYEIGKRIISWFAGYNKAD